MIKKEKLSAIVFLSILILFFTGCQPKSEKPNGNRALFSFGVIADAQYADIPVHGKRHYRSSLNNMEKAAVQLNTYNLDFVVHLGDMIEKDFNSFDDILPIYNKIKTKKYAVLGNHEFAVAPEKKDAVPGKLGLDKRYFSINQKGWKFIFLDGQDLSVMAHPPESNKYKKSRVLLDSINKAGQDNAQSWNGGLSSKQLIWLKEQLDDAEKNDFKVAVFSHFPVYPVGATHNLWNDREVVNLLEQYDVVKIYMNGHNHAGGDAIHNGIYYLNLKGMVENPDASTFAICHVFGNYIVIDGKGNEYDRVIPTGDVAGWSFVPNPNP